MRARVAFLWLFSAANLFAAATPAASTAGAAPPAPVTFEKTIRPFLQQYCYECHGHGESKGDVKLDAYQSVADVDHDHKTWETALSKLRHHEMPPDDAARQPSIPERDLVADWIEHQIYQYDPSNPDPGHVTLHRLNRAEYNNSIRDLTGIDFKAADDFPPDDSGYGFDNIGDVLSLPPMLMEKYLAAADKILDQAIATDPLPRHLQHVPANFAEVGFNAIGDRGDGWVRLISLEEDDVSTEMNIAAPGDYLVRFQAFAEQNGGAMNGAGDNSYLKNPGPPAPPILSVRLGDTKIKEFTVTATDPAHPGVYEARVGVPAGAARFRVVMDRLRGGANELIMTNGKIGKQQNGIGYLKWIEVDGPLDGATTRYLASQAQISGDGYFSPATTRVLTQAGNVSVKFDAPRAGDYILRVYGYALQAGPDPARVAVSVDGKPLQTFDVLAPARLEPLDNQRLFSITLLRPIPQAYEIHTQLAPGPHVFSAAFLNPFSDPKNDNPNLRQRALAIQSLEVVDLSSPARLPEIPPALKPYFTGTITAQNQAASARDILTQFARRAWRRPPPPDEVNRLMQLYDLSQKQGDSFLASIKLAMKAVLISPHFLFREDQPDPPAFLATEFTQPAPASPAASGFSDEMKQFLHLAAAYSPPPPPKAPDSSTPSLGVPIDEFSLATRLSYFLWSSTPDDELLNLAQHNQLRAHLDEQVRRMLASPKSRALVDNFASQWLQYRSLDTFDPDKTLFPDFNPALRTAMRKETENFFDYIMRQDRSVMDFLTANYTFVNGPLADFYGLKGVSGEEFQKVSLVGTARRGVLTQGSVLVLTSNPTRTSPVKRGKWVLENLLGTPPPPPPPNVPVLDEEHQLTGTLRQQMEQHRANPTCASCHARMDPIGFSLENFDAVGALREMDGNVTVDTSGKLVTGESFSGAVELVQLLADKKHDEFLHCLAEKMLTYALGRGLEYYDRDATDRIVRHMEQNGDKFSSLILGVVYSLPFQDMRRAEAAGAPGVTPSETDAPPPQKVAQN